MLKYIFLLLGFITLSGALKAQDMYKVTGDNLNIRETEKPNSRILGHLPEGENVMVLDSSKVTVFKVKVTNGEGWVSSKFLQRIAAPKKSPVKVQVKAVQKQNNETLYIGLLIVVAAIGIGLIYKFANSRQFLIWLTAIVVLAVIYLSYLEFFKQKAVAGLYATATDEQYKSFDFMPKDSVTVINTYTDSTFTVHYKIENDVVKFADGQNTIMLLIMDDNTLEGQGFTSGTYKKN
ncbi:SH3 domain-containing protein [Pedobacter sp. UYP30]|uniref:SH3 domain-containing protein n=1 Tax=Pedobacter sp. UYP30 TaxID=1756400 RepID=UPI0033914859